MSCCWLRSVVNFLSGYPSHSDDEIRDSRERSVREIWDKISRVSFERKKREVCLFSFLPFYTFFFLYLLYSSHFLDLFDFLYLFIVSSFFYLFGDANIGELTDASFVNVNEHFAHFPNRLLRQRINMLTAALIPGYSMFNWSFSCENVVNKLQFAMYMLVSSFRRLPIR